MSRAILFDLDGTLVHSAPDLHAAANRLLAEEGATPLSLAEVTSFIGNGIPTLVERIMAARGLEPSQQAALTDRYRAIYAQDSATLTRAYPGVGEALTALRAAGHRLGVCTNKPEAPARDILASLDLAPFFEVVIGGDTLPQRKPDPAPLRMGFDRLGAGAPLFVGDSEVDAACAKAAGTPFVLFTEGYRKAPVAQLPHVASFAAFPALPGVIAALA